MPRPSKRAALLQAASHVIQHDGAARLSLDRVAATAGVSKGGLLYHFPDRHSLLRALVGVLIERFEAHIQAEDDHAWAHQYVRATLDAGMLAESGALIVAVAEDRHLLAPLIARMAAWRARLRSAAADPVGAEMVFLAADAVWYAELLGLPVPPPDERGPLRDRLLSAIDDAFGEPLEAT